jgi:hypothetical protein
MTATAKAETIVRATLKKQFPKIRVVRIGITEKTDDDGDPIIEIEVVYEEQGGGFDPAELRKLPRLIMPELSKAKERGFPIFSFIEKSDLGKLSPAAA